jgi:hypothetical protein
MLANPVIIPAYANPLMWAVALLAIWGEIATTTALLRRHAAQGLARALFVFNAATWFAFLVAVDRLDAAGVKSFWSIAELEGAVVVVETGLLWIALRSRALAPRPVGLLTVLRAVFVGNVVSVVIGFAPFALLEFLL